jgi:cell wall-associated NlpC family hydrolase
MSRLRAASILVAAGLSAGGLLVVGESLTAAAEAAPAATLHVGSHGAQVTWVQRQLHVPVTGYYGPQTRAAVLAFQHRQHIGVSGAVGPATMGRLQGLARTEAARVAAARRAPGRPAPRRPAPRRPAPRRVAPLSVRVIQVAASQRGKPYVFGATGPRSFDCSGFTRFVYSRVGKRLPRTTWAQYAATKIPRSQLRPGDLIFSGDLSHVGIYAGWGSEWNAPHTGARVRLQRVWDPHYKVGRVR